MSTSVTRAAEPDRFEISVDANVAGLTQFVEHDGRRVFFHTEVGEEFGGQGLAGDLVEEAVAATRADGLTLVPVCSYIQKWLSKHPEHSDIVAKPTPADLAAIPG